MRRQHQLRRFGDGAAAASPVSSASTCAVHAPLLVRVLVRVAEPRRDRWRCGPALVTAAIEVVIVPSEK